MLGVLTFEGGGGHLEDMMQVFPMELLVFRKVVAPMLRKWLFYMLFKIEDYKEYCKDNKVPHFDYFTLEGNKNFYILYNLHLHLYNKLIVGLQNCRLAGIYLNFGVIIKVF